MVNPPPSRSPSAARVHAKRLDWRPALPGLALIGVIVLAGFVLQRPHQTIQLAPAPRGWTRTLGPGKVLALAFWKNSVFAGGRDGLFELDQSTGQVVREVPFGRRRLHIRSLDFDKEGSLWVGHIDGLVRMSNKGIQSWTEAEGLPANRVNVVRVLPEGVIIGTSRGLAVLRNGRWTGIPENQLLASKVVNCLLRASDGALWVGSSSDPKGGLTRLYRGKAQVWTIEGGLPHPYVQDLEEPSPGEVWAATGQLQQGGAVCFKVIDGKAVISRVETQRSGLAGAKVRSSGVTPSGQLIFGSENDGMAVQSRGGWQVITTKQGLPHNEVTAIETDPKGILWIATLDGVVRVDPSVSGSLPPEGSPSRESPRRSH